MASIWTHAICAECFAVKRPDTQPTHVDTGEQEHCCYCGRETRDGIYYRDDPATTPCKGQHKYVD